jgi:hypothetical protein
MPDPERGTDRAGRRAKRFLSPSQKYEIFLQLVRLDDPKVLRGELAVIRSHYNGVRLHAGIGYVCPDDEHEGRGQASAKPGRPGSRMPASDASPTIDPNARQHRPGDPAMLTDRAGISIAKSETRHAGAFIARWATARSLPAGHGRSC